MKALKFFILLLLVGCLVLTVKSLADAQDPGCGYSGDDWFDCGIGGGSGGAGEVPPEQGKTCQPGASFVVVEQHPIPNTPQCLLITHFYDCASGEEVYTHISQGLCQTSSESDNPCDHWSTDGWSFSCLSRWNVQASIGLPEIFLDLRPFPATLVRWPTAARYVPGGSSSTGYGDYYTTCGGSAGDPKEGDWSGLSLTLSFQPAGPMYFDMPVIGTLVLPPKDSRAAPELFQWEVPSHPAVGKTIPAGQVPDINAFVPSQIAEAAPLPADLPLFSGSARAPYRLFWSLRYSEYVEHTEDYCDTSGWTPAENAQPCSQRDEDGNVTATGYLHQETVGEWQPRSRGGEITPGMLGNLPSSYAADLNGDGNPEAFWSYNVTVRRMDYANSVDNPVWRAFWKWGGRVFWGVREGQGQIGWPGGQ